MKVCSSEDKTKPHQDTHGEISEGWRQRKDNIRVSGFRGNKKIGFIEDQESEQL